MNYPKMCIRDRIGADQEESESSEKAFSYTTAQKEAIQTVWNGLKAGQRTWLIHGVTGSGKTALYIEWIKRTVSEGRQAIVLIPEIALTYQTVMRFYHQFGDRVSIMNSRLSAGERYDQDVYKRQMLDRTAGIPFEIGIFTNLGHDHIGPNEHKDFEDYKRCNCLLYTSL